MTQRGILIVPDVLASAGGVVISYFEWVQNNQGYYWTEEEVNEKLEKILAASSNHVYETSVEKQADMRLAAYIVGLKKDGRSCNLARMGIVR